MTGISYDVQFSTGKYTSAAMRRDLCENWCKADYLY